MTALPVVDNAYPLDWLVCLDCRTVVQSETDEVFRDTIAAPDAIEPILESLGVHTFWMCPKCETLLSEPERVCAKVAPTEDEVAEAWGLAGVWA
jgi:hypothetical protein